MKRPKILILNLNPSESLADELRCIIESQFDVEEVKIWQKIDANSASTDRGQKLAQVIPRINPSVIFVVQSADRLKDTRQFFHSLRIEVLKIPLVVVVDEGEPDEMIAWIRQLAADFLTKPLKRIDVLPRVWRLLDQSSEPESHLLAVKKQLGMRELIGESETFRAQIEKIPLVAKCDASILITGDTGTGKELCARAIHYLSPRAGRAFIPVNCGAIPGELVENELFGHAAGAFTSAKTAQHGLIDEANGGTLFLDEVDCLPLMAQVKLLRFLQEKEYRALGATKIAKADLRVIAASSLNCEEAVREGKIRQDLYYRLNVILLTLPALRDRQEDIPLLAHHFLNKYAIEFDKQVTGFSPDAIRKLILYNWPGNVRELEHVIMRALVLSAKPIICGADIAISDSETLPLAESFQEAKNRMVDQFEKTYIKGLLLSNHCNISRSAKAAQKNRRAFWELIRKHDISVQGLKSRAS
ncbi:MAG: sigma-54-dependent Fis family transcriptional regulator [Pyrinomonadaceae bacterium]|nr:sigma-54-dependent Fis family transcriptional regulator [Pyrinomonadaceae bacterium]